MSEFESHKKLEKFEKPAMIPEKEIRKNPFISKATLSITSINSIDALKDEKLAVNHLEVYICSSINFA